MQYSGVAYQKQRGDYDERMHRDKYEYEILLQHKQANFEGPIKFHYPIVKGDGGKPSTKSCVSKNNFTTITLLCNPIN